MPPVIRQPAEQVAPLSRDQMQASQQAAQAGIDLLRTNVEVFQRSVESTMDLMTQMVGRSANGSRQVSGATRPKAGQLAQQSCRNVEAMSTMTDALSDIWVEWVSFVQKRARQNVDHWNLFFSCRTPQDFFVAQNELLRENAEDVLQSGRRIAEKSMRLSSVGRKIAATAEQLSRIA